MAFSAIAVVKPAIDLFLIGGGKQHRVSFRETASLSMVLVTVSLLLAAFLWWYLEGSSGRQIASVLQWCP